MTTDLHTPHEQEVAQSLAQVSPATLTETQIRNLSLAMNQAARTTVESQLRQTLPVPVPETTLRKMAHSMNIHAHTHRKPSPTLLWFRTHRPLYLAMAAGIVLCLAIPVILNKEASLSPAPPMADVSTGIDSHQVHTSSQPTWFVPDYIAEQGDASRNNIIAQGIDWSHAGHPPFDKTSSTQLDHSWSITPNNGMRPVTTPPQQTPPTIKIY